MEKIESDDKPFMIFDDDDEPNDQNNITTPISNNLIDTELAAIVYDLFSGSKLKTEIRNPSVEFTRHTKLKRYDHLTDTEFQAYIEQTKTLSELWDDQPTETLGKLIENAIKKFDRQTAEAAISLLLDRVPKCQKSFTFNKAIVDEIY